MDLQEFTVKIVDSLWASGCEGICQPRVEIEKTEDGSRVNVFCQCSHTMNSRKSLLVNPHEANEITPISNRWSDYANSSPVSDILSKIEVMHATLGECEFLMTPDVSRVLMQHPDIIEAFKNSHPISQKILRGAVVRGRVNQFIIHQKDDSKDYCFIHPL